MLLIGLKIICSNNQKHLSIIYNMNRLELIRIEEYPPEIQGEENRSVMIIEPFLEFDYTPKERAIPTKLAIKMTYTGEPVGFDFSFSIKVLGFFNINSELLMEDVHNAHLKLMNRLIEQIKSKTIDRRLWTLTPQILTLNQSIEFMIDSNEMVYFISDLPGK